MTQERERGDVKLSETQLDEIAERVSDNFGDRIADRAADKVIAAVQLEIGKSALRALSYVVGAAVVALVAWLTAKGYLKI